MISLNYLVLCLRSISSNVWVEFEFDMFLAIIMTIGLVKLDWNDIVMQNHANSLSKNMLAERIR